MDGRTKLLFIGVGGHVVAIDPTTGEERWRVKTKGGSYVTVKEAGDRIYAGAGGHLFALDATTGAILWENPLKGLGWGILAFAGDSILSAVSAEAASRAAASSAGVPH